MVFLAFSFFLTILWLLSFTFPAVQGIASSYTSDSEPNQSQSVSECSSVSDENNAGNLQSANPQDGDVMFHSEDDFNFSK
jgi:cytoskeletal protein RodZ